MIQVMDGRKSYSGPKGGEAILALDGIDLNVASGEFVCVLGPSGCGKTTLLKAVMGLISLDAGTIKIDGKPVKGSARDCAMVFQNFALLPWADVIANVAFGLELRGTPKRQREEKARELIQAVGLCGFERAYPHQLSGGMQQRVGLARALAVEPRILLLDEPFGALDDQTRQMLQEDLKTLIEREPKTVLCVTHSVEEALRLATSIVLLTPRPGRVREVIRWNGGSVSEQIRMNGYLRQQLLTTREAVPAG